MVAAAYRLGPLGREVQQDLARCIRSGNAGEGWARVVSATMLPTRLQGPAQPLVRLMTRPMAPKGPRESKDPKDPKTSSDSSDSSDLLVTLGFFLAALRD